MTFPPPPTLILLLLHEQAPTRPIYDMPPLIVRSPLRARLRALAARLTRRRPAARPTGSTPAAARKTASLDR